MEKLMILLCLFSFMSQGCKKGESQISKVNDTFVSISYSDLNNADLLDPDNPNAIKADDIEIYYLENGEKHRVYNATFDLPKNFKIGKSPNDGRYYFSIAVSEIPDKKGVSTTYIEIKDRTVDTLTTTLYKSESITRVTQAWYNNTLKWDGEGVATFNVIK